MSQLPPLPDQPVYQQVPMAPSGGGKAIAALVLGIVSCATFCLSCVSIPSAIVGLILGILDLKGPKKRLAKAGVILSVIGIVLTMLYVVAMWQDIRNMLYRMQHVP